MCRLRITLLGFKSWLHPLQAADLKTLTSLLYALISLFLKWKCKNYVQFMRVKTVMMHVNAL